MPKVETVITTPDAHIHAIVLKQVEWKAVCINAPDQWSVRRAKYYVREPNIGLVNKGKVQVKDDPTRHTVTLTYEHSSEVPYRRCMTYRIKPLLKSLAKLGGVRIKTVEDFTDVL